MVFAVSGFIISHHISALPLTSPYIFTGFLGASNSTASMPAISLNTPGSAIDLTLLYSSRVPLLNVKTSVPPFLTYSLIFSVSVSVTMLYAGIYTIL